MEAEHKRMQREHEQELSSMRAHATSKLQFEIHTLFMGVKEELRLELKNQKQLEFGKDRIEKLLIEGGERKGQLEEGKKEMEVVQMERKNRDIVQRIFLFWAQTKSNLEFGKGPFLFHVWVA